MDARVSKLISEFEENGWISHGAVDVKEDWWFKEIILMKSRWHPVDKELYLTMLIDPQVNDRKIVWAINISTSVPKEVETHIEQITLNDIKRTDLKDLVRKVNNRVLNADTC